MKGMRLLSAILALLCLVPLFAGAAEKADLPNVLIIGDSSYQNLVGTVTKELKGKANVTHTPGYNGEICNTPNAVQHLDKWLGETEWDVIHFNFGFADMVHTVPGLKQIRSLPKSAGGVPAVTPEDYAKNLEQIVKMLRQKTKARLIWASTFPITKDQEGILVTGDDERYNALAESVMKRANVEINDLHTYITEQLKDVNPRQMPDPFAIHKKVPVHEPIIAAITGK